MCNSQYRPRATYLTHHLAHLSPHTTDVRPQVCLTPHHISQLTHLGDLTPLTTHLDDFKPHNIQLPDLTPLTGTPDFKLQTLRAVLTSHFSLLTSHKVTSSTSRHLPHISQIAHHTTSHTSNHRPHAISHTSNHSLHTSHI